LSGHSSFGQNQTRTLKKTHTQFYKDLPRNSSVTRSIFTKAKTHFGDKLSDTLYKLSDTLYKLSDTLYKLSDTLYKSRGH